MRFLSKKLLTILLSIFFLWPSLISAETDYFNALGIQRFPDYPPAPLFSLPDLNGKTLHLADYKGRPLMLYFWATW